MNIVGERVALGPLRADLLPLYGRWINDFGTIWSSPEVTTRIEVGTE